MSAEAIVPCNGCTACCVNDAVRLLPGDDVGGYLTEPHPWMSGERVLAHKDNGECVYLGNGGCTIHARRPRMCRTMDCRNIARGITFEDARELRIVRVWRRGRELLAA